MAQVKKLKMLLKKIIFNKIKLKVISTMNQMEWKKLKFIKK